MIPPRHAGARAFLTPFLVVSVVGIVACVVQKPLVKQVDLRQTVTIQSPAKAHLVDGSTIVYPNGVSLANNSLSGYGSRFALGSSVPTLVQLISIDSVVGMESFGREVNAGASVALSILGVAAGTVGTAAALVAVFGSCPTIYADSAGTELLQAESFSYSIAPLFEQRDVDRLRLTPTPDGRVVLHVKNEALETHFINQLELLEVRHGVHETAVPDGTGHPVVLGEGRLATSIRDRSGRDVSATVRAADNQVFATIDARLVSVTSADLDDFIDVSFVPPAKADSVAVILDMRNSLLNTVLLYDHILGAPGLKSLDFLGKDLDHISNAVTMGRWYTAHMGMRVSVLDGDKYRPVARIGDSGPIAFHRLAVMVPAIVGPDGSVHARLSFVADDWRIDEISVADRWRRPAVRTVELSRFTSDDPAQNAKAASALREPDQDYLITSPGQSFRAEFDVGKDSGEQRTWFAVSQGYYTEWVRGDWIKHASGKPFTPTNDALVDAIRGWRTKQAAMETHFYNERISAR